MTEEKKKVEETVTPPDAVPYSRFKEINDKNKIESERADEAEKKLKEIEEAQAKAILEKAEADGELQKVNDVLKESIDRLKSELQPKADQFDLMDKKIREESLAALADKLGDEDAAKYADFDTAQLQMVAKTFLTTAEAPAPNSDKGGQRNTDEGEAAALKKYGSKANIARLNRDLYRKLYPNPRRKLG